MGHGKFQAKFRMKKIQILVLLILGSLFLTYLTIWYLPTQSIAKSNSIKPSLENVQYLINVLQNMSLILLKMENLKNKPTFAKFEKFPTSLLKHMPIQLPEDYKKIVLISGHDLQTGYLKHVFELFQHYGYMTTTNKSTKHWDILWHHDYPFVDSGLNLSSLTSKKVNHFPGSGFITNKVTLMEFKDGEIRAPYLPIAYSLPKQAPRFSQYAKAHPNASWVLKGNDHRGIQVLHGLGLGEIVSNASSAPSQHGFIQLFVPNPFLIDGRKFDIGLYVAVTSVVPLVVYAYYGDILFRFCPLPYNPFDPAVKDKYVVADDYIPVWEMPSLKAYYKNHGTTFKSALAAHFTTLGLDVGLVWAQIDHIVRDTFLRKRGEIVGAHGPSYKPYLGAGKTFFEMVRFDFILDDSLMVHLMEVNMSPNLSSDHFPPNSRLYKRLLNDLLHLLGFVYASKTRDNPDEDYPESEMEISFRDLSVFPLLCATHCQNQTSCWYSTNTNLLENKFPPCQVCSKCRVGDVHTYEMFARAFLEHGRKQSFQRILPPLASSAIDSNLYQSPYPPITIYNPLAQYLKGDGTREKLKMVEDLFAKNERTMNQDALLHLWFVGKCMGDDKRWCF